MNDEECKYEVIGMYYPTRGCRFDYCKVTNSKREAKRYFKQALKKYYYASIIVRNPKRIEPNLLERDNYNADTIA